MSRVSGDSGWFALCLLLENVVAVAGFFYFNFFVCRGSDLLPLTGPAKETDAQLPNSEPPALFSSCAQKRTVRGAMKTVSAVGTVVGDPVLSFLHNDSLRLNISASKAAASLSVIYKALVPSGGR